MAEVTPKPLEDVVHSTQSSSSADSVDVNRPLNDVPSPQEPETSGNNSGPESDENSSEIEDETSPHPNGNVSSIQNPSVGAGEPTETPLSDTPVSEPISPAEAALEVIKNQDTHCLYCSVCKSNITKDAVLFKNGEETYPYNTAPYVLWLPRLNLPWIRRFDLSWIRRFNLSWIPRNFNDLTPPSPWFLLVVVLLVLSINVTWFLHSPVIPPGPPPVAPPPGSPPHVPPPPGPFVTPPGPHFPQPPPGPGPYEKIRWLIYFLSSNYLSIFSLLFLVILALLWPSISTSIDSLIKAAIERCSGILPLCRDFINSLKALVTPARARTPTRTRTRTRPQPQPQPQPQDHDDDQPQDQDQDDDQPQDKDHDDDQPQDQDQDQDDDQPQDQDQDDDQSQDQDDDQPQDQDDPVPKLVVVFGRYIVDRLRNLDILKSIVYGGLIESITGLGVVSSAAASGATTLNVLALGVTSLFSGGILIFHSLLGLKTKHLEAEERAKNNPSTNVEGEEKEETPYQEQLGNYRNVILHRVVVMTSFVVFGMIPPLCYGLFFRKTDKGHYKAAVVLAVSLVCVILLSSAKVYAFKLKNKFRTVAEYTGMAFGASALSFITSQIFSEMLDKYGFHELAKEYRRE